MVGYVTDTYGNTQPWGSLQFNGVDRGPTPTGPVAILPVSEIVVSPVPPDPLNLAVMPTAPTTATLTWDASPLPGLTDYVVFRRTPPSGAPFVPGVDTPVGSGVTALTYPATGLTPATVYEWQVFARVAWTPADLPSLIGWWTTADLATITASGSPAKASQWNAKAGTAGPMLQSTGANQPTTGVITVNGYNAFSALGAACMFATITYPAVSTGSFLAVWKPSLGAAASARLLSVADTFADYNRDENVAALYLPGWPNVGTYHTAPQTSAAHLQDVPNAVAAVYAPSSWELYVNGTLASSSAPVTPPLGPTWAAFGSQATGGSGVGSGETLGANSYLCELVVTSATLTSTDRANWFAYCHSQWGTP
jgi:hypothetical protein